MNRLRRMKLEGVPATYHAMSRVVGGERLFESREKEVLRKMLWQVADFCGVEILTYCVMSNHFHVLVRVPEKHSIPDAELLRRFKVLYPKPTKYQTVEFARLEKALREGNEDAVAIRERLLARMHDLSEFMKTVKQRFSIWYNRNHGQRRGTLWMDRFKSVLVQGEGTPLQTMAAYIDLNPVRAGLVTDPKDYRFCGYAEAVAGSASSTHSTHSPHSASSGQANSGQASSGQAGSGRAPSASSGRVGLDRARKGLCRIWADRGAGRWDQALESHREWIFGTRASEAGLSPAERAQALEVLEKGAARLPRATLLRCRVRYFTDGAILGSEEFVRSFMGTWQAQRGRRHPPKVHPVRGGDWGDLAVIQGLRRKVFG